MFTPFSKCSLFCIRPFFHARWASIYHVERIIHDHIAIYELVIVPIPFSAAFWTDEMVRAELDAVPSYDLNHRCQLLICPNEENETGQKRPFADCSPF
jgi:hypothetical protein